ncbi:MAG: hypothetical protein JNM56_15165 [Planctomycetia bacterium]|nr:hypothetical protein [Planctomycetia bacterium]
MTGFTVLVVLLIVALCGVSVCAIAANDGANRAGDQQPQGPTPAIELTKAMRELIAAHRKHMAFLESPCPESDDELAYIVITKFGICPFCLTALDFDVRDALARSGNRATFIHFYGDAVGKHERDHPECKRALEQQMTPDFAEHLERGLAKLNKEEIIEACPRCRTDLFAVRDEAGTRIKLCPRCSWTDECDPSEAERAAAEKDIHAWRRCTLEAYYLSAPGKAPDWLLDALASCTEPVNRDEDDPEMPATYAELVAEVRQHQASSPSDQGNVAAPATCSNADPAEGKLQGRASGILIAMIDALKPEALALPDGEALIVVHSAGREDRLSIEMTDDRFAHLQSIGMLYAANGESPSAVFLATKMWASRGETKEQPTNDPKRVDAAIVMALTGGGFGLAALHADGAWETAGITAIHVPLLQAFWAGVAGKPTHKPVDKSVDKPVRLFHTRWHGQPPWPPSTSNPEFFRGLARLPDKDLALMARTENPLRWARLTARQRRKEIKALRKRFAAEAERLSDL